MELGIPGLTDPVEIGRGGFAVVYRAFQTTFERLVAVKVFADITLNQASRALFERECRAIGRISGRPNILTVHDAGITSSGRPYLIMAFMAGGSLEDRMQREGPLGWPEVVDIGVKVAKALDVAHNSGVMHRDVKPANVLMSVDGEPQLADFGIARLTDVTQMTRSGLSFTPVHVAPEVLAGGPVSPSIDLYSLGSTMFSLIAGRAAFIENADDGLFVIMRRVEADPVPDLLRPRGVPEEISRFIERAMAKDPADRPPSAAAFAAELETARQVGREAEDRARWEAEDHARRDAEKPARPEAEDRAMLEAQDGARREAADQAQRPPEIVQVGVSGVSPVGANRSHFRAYAIAMLAALLVCGAVLVFVRFRGSSVSYAATVNGVAISQNQLDDELADISANAKYVELINQPGGVGPVAGSSRGTYNQSFVAVLLDQQVRFEVIRQKLVASHALPTAAQVASARAEASKALPSGIFDAFPARYQALLATQQAEEDAFVNGVVADMPGDQVDQFYQSHLNEYATSACVRHILIADKDASSQLDFTASLADANKVKAQLDAGGDFAGLAKQYSQDNQGAGGGSAAQGGAVGGKAADGCLTTGDLQQLVTAFAQSVTSLPLNKVSDPVKSQFGYHLIEVTKRVIEPLDSAVTSDIHQRLAGQRLNQLVASAHVQVNPTIGHFDSQVDPATGSVRGVVPPPGFKPPSVTTTSAA